MKGFRASLCSAEAVIGIGGIARSGIEVSLATEWPTITLLPGRACAAAIAIGFAAPPLRAEARVGLSGEPPARTTLASTARTTKAAPTSTAVLRRRVAACA